jgi:hypothetical protein
MKQRHRLTLHHLDFGTKQLLRCEKDIAIAVSAFELLCAKNASFPQAMDDMLAFETSVSQNKSFSFCSTTIAGEHAMLRFDAPCKTFGGNVGMCISLTSTQRTCCAFCSEARLKNRPEHQQQRLRCSTYTIAPIDHSGRYILRVSVIFFSLFSKKKYFRRTWF